MVKQLYSIPLFFFLICFSGLLIAQESEKENDFQIIFNGKDLTNWEGDSTYWRVENGCLVGEVLPETLLKQNSFIIWKGGTVADFELKLEYRVSNLGNSGINYRSQWIDTLPYALKGYQADLDGRNKYTGQNYDERKRTILAFRGQKVQVYSQPEGESMAQNVTRNVWQSTQLLKDLGGLDSLGTFVKKGEWNTYYIIARGNRLQHYVNGVLMSDVIDDDIVNRSFEGLLGVQVHVGPPMKIEYRNIRLKTIGR